jgi:hypothetical protein
MFSRQASWKRRRRTTFRPPDRPDRYSPPHRPDSAQRTRPATGVCAELQRRRRHQRSFMEAESTPERLICVQPPAQPVRWPAAPIRRGWCAIRARASCSTPGALCSARRNARGQLGSPVARPGDLLRIEQILLRHPAAMTTFRQPGTRQAAAAQMMQCPPNSPGAESRLCRPPECPIPLLPHRARRCRAGCRALRPAGKARRWVRGHKRFALLPQRFGRGCCPPGSPVAAG